MSVGGPFRWNNNRLTCLCVMRHPWPETHDRRVGKKTEGQPRWIGGQVLSRLSALNPINIFLCGARLIHEDFPLRSRSSGFICSSMSAWWMGMLQLQLIRWLASNYDGWACPSENEVGLRFWCSGCILLMRLDWGFHKPWLLVDLALRLVSAVFLRRAPRRVIVHVTVAMWNKQNLDR